MLCDSCGKNQATVHYTEIINGETKKMHLCQSCTLDGNEFNIDSPFSLHKIFTGLIGPTIKDYHEQEIDLKCDKCGLTYGEFKSTGKLGCGNCYSVFKTKIDPLIKGIQGNSKHKGKIPKESEGKVLLIRECESLQEELEEAVKNEEFEKAALLRDEIKKFKTQMDDYEE